MNALWLYPVRGGSGFQFSGQPDTSLRSFRNMLKSGQGDGPWSIATNYRNVRRGDKLVIYEAKTTEYPPLLIGTGTIRRAAKWHEGWQTYVIGVKLHREECKRLADFEVDASYLMAGLPQRKRAVVKLPVDLQRWVESRLHIRAGFEPGAREVLDTLSPEIQKVTVETSAYEAVLRHDALVIEPLRQQLRRAGWDIIVGSVAGGRPDLIGVNSRRNRLLLVEGKTVSSRGGRIEIRYALGQLFDYEYFFLPTLNLPKAKRDRLILIERKPHDDLVGFVESLNIGLAWLTRKEIVCGPLAMRMLRGVL